MVSRVIVYTATLYVFLVLDPLVGAYASERNGDCTNVTIYHNTSCPDKAFKWTDEKSASACSATCCSTKGCLAWAYNVNELKRNCHLKYKLTKNLRQDTGVICGIFPGGAPTPPTPPAPAPPPRPTPPPNPNAPRPHLVFILQDGKANKNHF